MNAVATRERKGSEIGLRKVLLETEKSKNSDYYGALDHFLNEKNQSLQENIVSWLGRKNICAKKQELLLQLDSDISYIDKLLNDQVNEIIHNPRFQKLEASWRGLRYLQKQIDDSKILQLRVLNVTWKELARDLERAIEFDQSHLFSMVYNDEFGTPGGIPYGMLIGDYEVTLRPNAEHPIDDISVMRRVAQVATAAFAPFVTGVHPSFFGLDGFEGLGNHIDLEAVMRQPEYLRWRSVRDLEDARFIGLALPNILMRRPYKDDGSRTDGFLFQEQTRGQKNNNSRNYLWGNSAYAFGAVLMQSFAQFGWLADIRGVRQNEKGGGLVSDLQVDYFETDAMGLVPKYNTDVSITEYEDKLLSELGFLPLSHCKYTKWSAFFSSSSVQKPKIYETAVATVNARLSAMLQYTFCASRFGHYLKIIGRDMIGSFKSAADCERFLNKWINDYVTTDESIAVFQKAKYPLREAKIQIRDQPGKPGKYLCVAHLRPHYQLEQISSTVKLVTELSPAQPI